MVNPNGNDDEAFDLNSLINRHSKVVHLGTHALWQCRPQTDPSFLLQLQLPTATVRSQDFSKGEETKTSCTIM